MRQDATIVLWISAIDTMGLCVYGVKRGQGGFNFSWMEQIKKVVCGFFRFLMFMGF